MEEPAPEPEPEPEPEPKVEEIKPEADEKVLEEMEEKAPSPAPVESPPNTQEPPKVKLMCLYAGYFSVRHWSGTKVTLLCPCLMYQLKKKDSSN